MHPTAEKLSVGIRGYLRRVMGTVVPLRLSVGAVLEVLLVGVENSGHGVLIGRRFVVLSRARDRVQPIENLPDMIDHVSPKSCSV